jgi:hypothetical protein
MLRNLRNLPLPGLPAVLSLLISICLLLLTSCSEKKSELEINNAFENAGPLPINTALYGKIGSPGDIDYFQIIQDKKPQSNSLLRFSLTGVPDLDLVMDIYQDKKLVKQVDDNPESGSEDFSTVPWNPGDDLVVVVHAKDPSTANDRIPYKLSVTRALSRSIVEKEPNGSLSSATVIPAGHAITGFFSPGKDPVALTGEEEDWYSFEAGQDNMVMRLDLTAVPGVDSIMEVYDERGVLIRRCDDNGPGDGETLANIGVKYKGVYYIDIKKKDSVNNPAIPYTLLIDLQKHDDRMEMEDNDSPFTANSIPPEELIHGYINPSSDVDWYKLELLVERPMLLNVNVTAVEGLDLRLEVFNSDRVTMMTANNFGAGQAETIPNLLIRSSPVFVRISARTNANVEQQYVLSTHVSIPDKDSEYEPDDKVPIRIETGMMISGYISSPEDKDLFYFETPEKAVWGLNLTPPPGCKMTAQLFRADPDGFPGEGIEPSTAGQMVWDINPGRYVLGVQGDKPDIKNKYRFIMVKK